MNFKKAIGYGLLVWVIMFAVSCIPAAYKASESVWAIVLMFVAAIIVVYVVTGHVKPSSAGSALGYGLVWVIVGVILDYLISKQFAPNIFSLWSYWVCYLLVLMVPTLRVKKG